MNLMTATGWRATTAEKEDVIRRVEEKVEKVREKALEIKEVVTQKILSVEIRLLCPATGTPYDAREMEDAYSSGREADTARPGQSVLWSTGLGMQYIVRSSSGRGSSETILKAKVGLVAPT
jgi:hypothetical protein